MAITQMLCPILQRENIAVNTYRYTLLCPPIARDAHQGQFVHILPEGYSLRRPISLCDIDSNRGTITLVFAVRGLGTESLSRLNVGECCNVLGPLGHGFTLHNDATRVCLIGGGIGAPPMLSLAKYYQNRATVICGFRNATNVILMQEFAQTGANVILCTDDGSAGRADIVTTPLREILENPVNYVYACGPTVMLRAVSELCQKTNTPCEISLEERMACGIGACLGCSIPDIHGTMRHVCSDGPVFDSRTISL